MFLTLLLFCLISPFISTHSLYFIFPLFSINPLKKNQKQNNPSILTHKGEDLERNDGSAERPFFMSPELHEILSKVKRLEDDANGIEQLDSPKQMDEVKLEEETPLRQQDGEIQLKEQVVLKQGNEEEHPLQSKTDAEEPKEERNQEPKASETDEVEKKGVKEEQTEETEEAAEKKEEEAEEAAAPAAEVEQEEKEELKEEKPPSSPQE